MNDQANLPQERPCDRHPDRMTMLSCGTCERPICTSCAVDTPVGVRCRECAGVPTGAKAVAAAFRPRRANVATIGVVAVTVAVFVLQMLSNSRLGSGLSGGVSEAGWLYGPDVVNGEWWRIITCGFLHAGIAHLLFNMLALWQLGTIVESFFGTLRFAAIYLVSIIWGSAGALLLTPNSPTVGASGGVFGLIAALLVLQWRHRVTIVPDLWLWLGLNLVLTFTFPGISIGGHIGGIVGGVLAALALVGFGRAAATGRVRGSALAGLALLAVVGVAAALWAAGRAEPSAASAAAPAAVTRTIAR